MWKEKKYFELYEITKPKSKSFMKHLAQKLSCVN